jgi:dolichyl-phosphate-mannose-protein mannosyltransferase
MSELRRQIGAGFLVVTLVLLLLLPRLFTPVEVIFDEHYFVDTVRYLRDNGEFRYLGPYTTHPPHGTIATAVAVSILGDNSVGWRAMPLLMHVVLMTLIMWLGVLVFNSFWVGLLAAFLFSLDGIVFGQATTLFFNAPMLVFLLLSFISTLCAQRVHYGIRQLLYICGGGLALGVAIGFRLPAFFFILVVFPMVLAMVWRLPERMNLLKTLGILVVGLAGGYFLPMLLLSLWGAWSSFSFVDFHRDTISVVYNLKCDHRYRSPWWSWPLLIRPVWYYFVPPAPYHLPPVIQGIVSLGNPVLFALIPMAILRNSFLWVKGKSLSSTVLLMAAFAMWLPWSLVDANTYIHYIYPTLPFTVLLVANWLVEMWRGKKLVCRLVAGSLVIAIVAVFILFYPIYAAIPISEERWKSLMWLASWI